MRLVPRRSVKFVELILSTALALASAEARQVRDRDARALDTIVVGAGPAGLMAAVYLARYRRSTLVLHDGASRAGSISLTRNAPGWPQGISGKRFLAQMAAQAAQYGASFHAAHVERVEKTESGFKVAAAGGERWSSRTLLLATGVATNQIPLADPDHQRALANRVLGYCPICDGFEHIDERIGVIGCDERGAKEALFLRQYSARVTLMPKSFFELDPRLLEQLSGCGIKVVHSPVDPPPMNGSTLRYVF